MDTVLLQLPDVERSVIEASISTEIASDPEFLTAYFTTEDAALSDRIAAAYNRAMTAFGQTMQGRGLTTIEVWKTVPAQAVLPENKVKKCGGARSGARTGLPESWAWQSGMFWTIPFCSAQTWKKRCAIPVLGYRTAKPDEQFGALLDAQLRAKASQPLFRKFRWTRCFPGRWGLEKKKKFRLSFWFAGTHPVLKNSDLPRSACSAGDRGCGRDPHGRGRTVLHAYYRM